ELGLENGARAFHDAIEGCGHVRDSRVPDTGLHSAHVAAGIALVPGPIEVLGHGPELHDQVAGEILRWRFPALLAPEPDEGCLFVAHNDAGVRAADEGAAVNLSSPHPRVHSSNSVQ